MPESNEPVTAFLGVGSNLGDRLANLRRAVQALLLHPAIDLNPSTDVASLYETHPVGVLEEQPDFLNSTMRISTTSPADALLQAVLSIERSLGRVRRKPGEARVIDIDILLYGDQTIHRADLTVPHQRLADRRFVLEPLAEIAAEVMHPVQGTSIGRLAQRCRRPTGDEALRRVAGPDWAATAC